MKILKTALVSVLFSAVALAQSAKSTVQMSGLNLLDTASTGSIAADGSYSGDWAPLLSASLHTSQQKDVIVGASLEVGLFTDTMVSSQRGNRDTSTAEAKVEVRVVLDAGTAGERIALPGTIVFNKRSQRLIAEFGGVLESCTDRNLDGKITVDECIFTDETLDLMLDTLSAHAFFFAIDDLGVGDHTLQVQARVSYGSSAQDGSASANAWVGKGGLTVEEVRFVQGADISL